ncbi:MAG: BspA family leucine-rich repeat surface protein [Flammeovirgaceae bacterium]
MKTRWIIITSLLLLSLAGQVNAQFITTWRTTTANETVIIPTFTGETYNYNVDWGDGQTSTNQTGDATHIYATADTFTVTITGTFPRIYFNSSASSSKVLTVEQWGNNPWTSMGNAFKSCTYLEINASDTPDLSNVTDMSGAFQGITNFNGDLSNWDVSNVQNMSLMFKGASSFNQDISGWNTANVTNMSEMFSSANSFNQPIGMWNTSSVTNMFQMLSLASSFNQDLGNWDVSNVTSFHVFKSGGTSWSTANIDKTLIGWSKQTLQNGILILIVGNYCHSADARQSIIDNYGWNLLVSGGQVCTGQQFITTWQTTSDGERITIPTFPSETYDYDVNWGDGQSSLAQTGDATHTYTTAGTYTVTITGIFPRIYFAGTGDAAKIQSVTQWGGICWSSFAKAFEGCSNLSITATDAPELTNVTDLSQMFKGSGIGNPNLSSWITSSITNMSSMFEQATNFSSDISAWNMSSLSNAANMLDNTNLSIVDYDNLLLALANQSLSSAVSFGAANLEHCAGASARQSLIDNFSWTITDGGKNCNSPNFFKMTWETTTNNESITIPTFSGETYNYIVDWGDNEATGSITGNATHTYAAAGSYTVTILGTFPRIYFNNSGDKDKLQDITQWGTTAWTSMANAFEGCGNISITATDAPDLSVATSTSQMFASSGLTTPDLSSWNMSNITDMTGMFQSATSFNGNISAWNTSSVQEMDSLFRSATSFTGDLSTWNTSSVQNMSYLFSANANFNGNISAWNTSNVQNMAGMFQGATSFTGDLSAWNTGNVTAMTLMFDQATNFNGNISSWNTGNVTDMLGMFANATSFNRDLNSWDVSKVISMRNMFINATAFNGNISNWDVSSLVSSRSMFDDAVAFNQDISNWNMISINSMTNMFNGAAAFNQNIGSWNMPVLNAISGMFQDATSFNQDISNWNTSNVIYMDNVFNGATVFNQNLGSWDLSSALVLASMFDNSGMTSTNYDSTLIGWSTQTLQNNQTFSAVNIGYCFASAARQSIIDNFGWTITDAGETCSDPAYFQTTWQTTTTNESITIPTNSGESYNYNIHWGDGQINTNQTGDATHTYASAGTYTVTITGEFPRLYINAIIPARFTIRTIEQWGSITWSSMNNAFSGASSLNYNATDVPDLSQVTDMSAMFNGCDQFNGAIGNWNVSNVTNMGDLFNSAFTFNQDISNWDVSNVTNMSATFVSASAFNQDISNWNVSNVTNMSAAFASASAFNQDLSNWNTANVTNMNSLFLAATAFNQDISKWNVSKVENMRGMFNGATTFNQNLGSWDISQVSNMLEMFNASGMSTSNYDQTLIGWSGQTLQNNVSLGATSVNYCLASAERQSMIDNFSWTINDGGSSCTLTTWNGATWDNGTPTASTSAIINSHYDTFVDGAIDAENLRVNFSNSLTLRGDSAVNLAGYYFNFGTTTVQDSTAFIQTAANPGNFGAGTYTVEREGTDFLEAYNYWSSPLQSFTINQTFGTNNVRGFYFDAPTQSWIGTKENTNMEPTRGYAVAGNDPFNAAATAVRSFSSTTGFNSGDLTHPLSFSNDADATNDWNLIGNPYPSGISVANFLATNYNGGAGPIANAVYLWNSDGSDVISTNSDYAIMNNMGITNAGGSTAPTSTTIASCQGFFVQAVAAGDVTFSNAHRTATNNTFLRTNTSRQRIWIKATLEDIASNEILIGFADDAEMGKDQYDAKKLEGNGHLAFYSQWACTDRAVPCPNSPLATEKLAIQGLSPIESPIAIPLGLHAKTAGQYTFNISHLDHFDLNHYQIVLIDHELEQTTHLQTSSYVIELESGEYTDRFELQFIPASVTSLEVFTQPSEFTIYSYENQVYFQASENNTQPYQIVISDLLGRTVYHQAMRIGTEKRSIRLDQVATGIYVVQVETATGKQAKRVWINGQ